MPDQINVSCNSLKFKELHGQNDNIHRPYPRHCAHAPFAPISAQSGKSMIEEGKDHDTDSPRRCNHPGCKPTVYTAGMEFVDRPLVITHFLTIRTDSTPQ